VFVLAASCCCLGHQTDLEAFKAAKLLLLAQLLHRPIHSKVFQAVRLEVPALAE
jgi:hypothetical protein